MIDDEVIDPTSTAIFGAISTDDLNSSAIAILSEEDKAAVVALPFGSALLIVKSGPSVGSRFLLNSQTITVGRHPDSDIFLDDVTVSRKHAIFEASNGGFLVRDAGSLNGTYVNRELVDTCELSVGDEVQIGKFRLTYHTSVKGVNLD
ncbi:FHA domain-containing protein [Actinomyces sp. zg-332]|uniref:FHA domain-containing protein n=1 Tax=Actinomyces sp. zg-332 TaxID=2708340 RepID=UPI00142004B5|nr:FHA domain-containing protein [Actinomyces sp. zg-332]QPK94697.1 FHA domain-containing protein [Actinomyces sp. zg-332]